MAQTILLKRSATPGKVPLTTDLALGEIGLNTYDGKMYFEKDNGTVSIVQVGTVTSVTGAGTVSGLTLTGTVTDSGSLTLGGTLAVTASNFASQSANTVLAAPNGSAGVPTFRVLANADIPTALTGKTYNALTLTAAATGFTVAGGTTSKTLTISNTLTFTGTDSSSVAFGAGGTVAYTSNNLSVFAPTTSSQLASVISDETGSGALVFATSPTLVTPVLGAATATSINGTTIPTSKTLVVTTDLGTSVQAYDADLAAIAALTGTTGNLTKTAVNTWALDTTTYATDSLVVHLAGTETITGNKTFTTSPTISSATPGIYLTETDGGVDLGKWVAYVNTNVFRLQTLNDAGVALLNPISIDRSGNTTIMGTVTADSFNSITGLSATTPIINGTAAIGTATTVARADHIHPSDTTKLSLAGGSMTGSIVIPTGQHITLTDAPSAGTDAVNKNYVDANLAGLSWKNAVRIATTANIALTGLQTIDGLAVTAGMRVLVKNQTAPAENGIYIASATAWSRSTDMDATTPINELNSAAVFVEGGTTQQDTGWTQINTVTTLGTDFITFTQFNGAAGITAGVGLVKTGNQLDISLGAGIAQLPTDEVGIDVYATGGLMTTVDGTASSTVTGAQLSLTKVGTAGTYKSVTTDAYGRITNGTNPTTLSGYGITDAQALDADLTAIAALAGTSGLLKKTAADTWSLDTTTYATDSSVVHITGTETITGAKTFSNTTTIFSTNDASTSIWVANNSSTAARWPSVSVTNYSGGFNGYPINSFNAYRGSNASPAPIQSGDTLGAIIAQGCNNVSGTVDDAARIVFKAASTFDGITDNGEIEFHTQTGTTLSKRMSVDASGNTSFYPGTVAGNFYMGAVSANPLIAFDATDFISYDRTANTYTFNIANVSELTLSSTDATFGGNVKITDNNNLFIGNGNDLYMIHDGTNSAIVNQTGNLGISNTAVGGNIVLASGSNLELWNNAAYLDATATYIRNQAGSSNYIIIDSSDLQSNVPILVTANPTFGQLDTVAGSASTWVKSMIRNDGTNMYFLTSGVQTTQALAMAATWTTARPIIINLTSGAVTLDGGGIGGTNIGGDLTVAGNLTVNGTTTTVNSTTVTVDDKNIELGSVTTPTNTTADGGGITLKGTTDKTIIWDNANANWTSSENWNLATGKAFKINNVGVLSATTLGSSVVTSSLTSVGIITSGTWSSNIESYSDTDDGTLSIQKFGRSTGQYISTHGGALGNYITSKSSDANPKNFALSVRTDTTTKNYIFGQDGIFAAPGAITGTSFNSITGLSSTSPLMDGTVAIGTGTTVARADHVHPSDTSKLSLTGGTVTGSITLSSTVPSLYFDETDAAVDLKRWLIAVDGSTLQIQTRTDANAYVAMPMSLTRSGNATFTGVVTAPSHDTTYGRTTSGTLTTTAVTQVEVPLALAAATYRTVEYLVQATSGTTYHTSKVHVIHDGTNTWIDEFSIMFTSASLYTISADISGGNIRLLVTPASATSTTFKVVATAIKV